LRDRAYLEGNPERSEGFPFQVAAGPPESIWFFGNPRKNHITMKDVKDQLYFNLNEKENQQVQEEDNNQDQEVEDTEENKETVSYNSDFEIDKGAKIQGSPVFSEDEIPLNSYKNFETILSWSKSKIIKENYLSLDLINPKIFRVWAEQFLIHPLLEPEYSTWVMSAEGESLYTVLSQLSESQVNSFSDFYSNHIATEALEEYWNDEMTLLGIELLTRLGIIRLGKARINNAPRTWIGRRSEESSPQIKFAAWGNDCSKIANDFIKKFVGENAICTEWEVGYRGGLWRILVNCPNDRRALYIEEHEESAY